ncbi:hypothetical protein PCANC_18105 [Puccinia coronata f. sp. avenae]|uniref:Uncharacterized protein n=1 Tax=Puccinia coronata f. sp. avenae TaxID=200324 RepID=A0A2N5SL83_9BASI|nr:hypothetical protein PCANC_18105 [Puccinia coronata f. sp. avenae]PLW16773.1 hypothetical protein PCASD_17160 [Puccinia coronata f. sp. avenae]
MTAQENQAQQSTTSDPPSRSVELKRRATLLYSSLHVQDVQFCQFAEEAGDDLAATFLEKIEEFFTALHSDDYLYRDVVMGFVSGSMPLPPAWTRTLQMLQAEPNSREEKQFAELAFLRRYPDLFSEEQFDLQAKIESLGKSLTAGRSYLEAKIKRTILNLDLITQGYNSAYVGHDDIITPIINTLESYTQSWQSRLYFAPYTCLIGPTMIGKSRLLMELAKEVCVMNICLRDHGSSGEPPRSPLADDMLPKSCSDDYYTRLIAAVLSVTIRYFENVQANDTEKYNKWSKYHTTTQFQSNVQKEMNSPSYANMKKDTPISALQHLCFAAAAVKKSAVLKDSALRVLLAIDEASAMLEAPEDRDISMFRLFRRAMRKIPQDSGIFVILVDTTSRVANFSPAAREDRSSRALGPRGKI